jgi:hypothetical protein
MLRQQGDNTLIISIMSRYCQTRWQSIWLTFVIGHGIGGKHIPTKWRISLRPDAGVSDDGLVCHHPTSQPHNAWWLWSSSTSTPRTTEISYEILSRISNASSNK